MPAEAHSVQAKLSDWGIGPLTYSDQTMDASGHCPALFLFTLTKYDPYSISNLCPAHFFASAAAGFGSLGGAAAGFGSSAGGAAAGTPPSMQLLHLLSTHPSMSFSPLPPKCRPPHSRAMMPAMTPTIVITARTTTSVSIDRCV